MIRNYPQLSIALASIVAATVFLTSVESVRAEEPSVGAVASGSVLWGNSRLAHNVTTSEQTVLRGSTTHLSDLAVGVVTLRAGSSKSNGEVWSAYEKLVLVKEGEIEIDIAGTVHRLGPGSIALLLPGEEYKIMCPSEDGDTSDEAVQQSRSRIATYYEMRYQSKEAADVARGQNAGGSFVVDFKDLKFEPHDKGGLRDYFDRATVMCDNFEMHMTTRVD